MAKTVLLNKFLLASIIVGGLVIILSVGLLSGLVARPKNCIATSTNSPSTQPQSTTSITSRPSSTTTSASVTSIFRLPTYFKSLNYHLVLKAFFEPKVAVNHKSYDSNRADDDRFEGEVKIRFKTEKTTNEIYFHIDRALNITEPIRLTNFQTNQAYSIKSGSSIPNQLYRLEMDAILPEGEYVLNIIYVGKFLGPATNGLYKTSYIEEGIRK